MKWLEIITIRSVQPVEKSNVLEIFIQTNRLKSAFPKASVSLYHHANIGSDVSFHIHWDGEKNETKKSTIGEFVSRSLKKYGLVNYSIWVNDVEPAMDLKI